MTSHQQSMLLHYYKHVDIFLSKTNQCLDVSTVQFHLLPPFIFIRTYIHRVIGWKQHCKAFAIIAIIVSSCVVVIEFVNESMAWWGSTNAPCSLSQWIGSWNTLLLWLLNTQTHMRHHHQIYKLAHECAHNQPLHVSLCLLAFIRSIKIAIVTEVINALFVENHSMHFHFMSHHSVDEVVWANADD